uniref:Pyruvate-flavodoxin oxidoreductase n=1 Tax=Candidatus Kentrum eta TaxID=2126337 RepID=A0A450VDQ8_9GAMM|nr:MAG: pyruvate-ferredoxin/flavodoxin oxidoreductase [Candidatus Kentron sp. H]VFJ96408.1 MAG: pyruvate-ferredoxin/flavodoxin oxidoreductase [Candidatus Kentron sp. H]VFK02904.1 MAG: pyruvate-ferredoxin/flavodoxin oxidoreductase [Candidatus Kentron sp. H]
MTENRQVTLDGNEAVAYVAYRVNEVCCIYPITPSSTMGELADQWSTENIPNLWGNIPTVVEMQSEGGASGALHGALQTGALSTTFTASQGLLLMIPNMYKIAGELTSTVFHVAARSLATQGLSIFGDHADVMAARTTGFAMLCSSSVQEAHDMALIAHAATLETRIPFLHFFDGFRTSHEVNKLTLLTDGQIRAMIRDDLVIAHRLRGLNPDAPSMRGTAQNPDIYFQARETVNPFYAATPAIVQETMDRLAELTGRSYRLFDYHGDEDAERIIVMMGSGAETVRETTSVLRRLGEKVGVVQVHLYRPFSAAHFLAAIPASVRGIAVLDRVKEPGATGEPLYMDVTAVLNEAREAGRLPMDAMPAIIGGRYGLSSKEFTPAMAKAVFDELVKGNPKNHFTVGIIDDVSHTSLDVDPNFIIEPEDVVRAMFFGLGADGTVGANKNTIKIIGEDPAFHVQGYFVYDSKKSGSQTVSHLRFGPKAIHSTYLIQSANFIGCHQFNFLERADVLAHAAPGGTFLLNSTHGPDKVWDRLPRRVQEQILEKGLAFYVIDAYTVAREAGMGTRINTIMQTCFFAISGVLPREKAIDKIKNSIRKTYSIKGEDVVRKNFEAVDHTLARLHRVTVPKAVTSTIEIPPVVPKEAPEFVRNVTAMMMAGYGDDIPVSALPNDGTYPTGTSAWEKRNISLYAPVWRPDICIQCGNCSLVCPHGVIRAKLYNKRRLEGAPAEFPSAPISGRGFPDIRFTLQVFVEDCTGCALCVEVCPAKDKERSGTKAINMHFKADTLGTDKENIGFFDKLPENNRGRVDFSTVRGVQYLTPLFAFSGACAGCGETPYLKLVSQLFGPRLVIANATGCSSIYGGNLPTTPWLKNKEGRGPVWSNSLFEDNAEFGFGFRLTADKHHDLATALLRKLRHQLGEELVDELLLAPQEEESEIHTQRDRVTKLKERLASLDSHEARHLESVADHLVRRSIWIVGGDGWAYDIGYGGLDHVLSMGRDVNILVLDTEVYSNTGGQVSKSTPLGAVAKFAAGGKPIGKKDLALQAIAYGNVYVARVALGANPQQAILAFREAETYKGPSLILAYSHCIAHGINMQHGLRHQKLAVESGHWPLVRYNPRLRDQGKNPFLLDSHRPTIKLKDYAYREVRYNVLDRLNPEKADELLHRAQERVERTWDTYEKMATRSYVVVQT